MSDLLKSSIEATFAHQAETLDAETSGLGHQEAAEMAAQGALDQVNALDPETEPDINGEIDAVLASTEAMEMVERAWSILNVTEEAVLKVTKGPDFKFKTQQEEHAYLAQLKSALIQRLAQEGRKLSGTGRRNLENNTSWDGVRPALLALKKASIIDNKEEIDSTWPASVQAAFEQALNDGMEISTPVAKQISQVVLEDNLEGDGAYEHAKIDLTGNPDLKREILIQAIVKYLASSPQSGLSNERVLKTLCGLQQQDARLEERADGTYGEKSVEDLIQVVEDFSKAAAEATPEEMQALEARLAAAEATADAKARAERAAPIPIPAPVEPPAAEVAPPALELVEAKEESAESPLISSPPPAPKERKDAIKLDVEDETPLR